MPVRDDCLDDATIAALAAGESAVRGALDHVADCTTCRELVSMACAARTNGIPRGGEACQLAAGVLLGRHRIERPLGAGGMGVVYLARDLELDRQVAVKTLRRRGETQNPEAYEALVRESQVLARLNHPHVVTVYEVGRHGGAGYLIMEHVEGGTVRDWLAAAPRSVLAIADVYAQAGRGLAAAHAIGLVHRDVKPDNVLVGADNRARISDFGLADTASAGDGTLQGTVRYMAPEVLGGAPADPRSDQWSLCASLWESLFGVPPFAGTTERELASAIARGLDGPPADPETPPWLRRALVRGLQIEPSDRFASVDDLARALVPPRLPVKRLVGAVLASAALAAGLGAMIGARPAPLVCDSQVAEWSQPQRAALARHFETIGGRGPSIAVALDHALDDYATRWSHQREDVCRAERTDAAGTLPVLRVACLETRRYALGAMVDALTTLDPVRIDHALPAVAALPALEDCAASQRLVGRQPRPSEPVLRSAIDELERRYNDARTRATLGQRRPAMVELVAIADAVDALGYYPLVADALGVVGRTELFLDRPQAIVTLRRAMWAAQAGGDDHQVADAALDVLSSSSTLRRPIAERDELCAQAAAAVARLRWRNDPAAEHGEIMLATIYGEDSVVRGELERAEHELRRSIELGSRLLGPRSSQLARSRMSLAKLLTSVGRYDEAALVMAEALEVDEAEWAKFADGLAVLGSGDAPTAMIDAAWRLVDVGRYDQALVFAHRVRAATPAAAMSTILEVTLDDLESEIALSRGELATARTLNARAITAMGANEPAAHVASLWGVRGEIFEASGDCKAASRDYRATLAALGRETVATQTVNLGLARCLAAEGDLRDAQRLVERLLANVIQAPRILVGGLQLAADLRWRMGQRELAHEAARAGLVALERLPALVRERHDLEAWIAAHPIPAPRVAGRR